MINIISRASFLNSVNFKFSGRVFVLSIFFTVLSFQFVSCDRTVENEGMSEGYIDYEISYLQNSLKTIPTELLPKKMVYKFRNENTIQKIDGFLGFFSIFHLVNKKKSINSTFLKIRNHKYCYPGNKGEMIVGFDTMEGMEITPLPESKEIAGFEAKKALISFPCGTRNSFYVYYTEDIPLKNPNASNPFKEINGVLLEFQLKFHNLDMLLVAKDVVFQPVNKKEFNSPEEFKSIPKSEMERIIGLLLE